MVSGPTMTSSQDDLDDSGRSVSQEDFISLGKVLLVCVCVGVCLCV